MPEYRPDSIEGVRKVLSGLDPNMKVETGTAVPLLGNTVAELCSLSIWPTDLVVIVPQHPERPESVVKVERGNCLRFAPHARKLELYALLRGGWITLRGFARRLFSLMAATKLLKCMITVRDGGGETNR